MCPIGTQFCWLPFCVQALSHQVPTDCIMPLLSKGGGKCVPLYLSYICSISIVGIEPEKNFKLVCALHCFNGFCGRCRKTMACWIAPPLPYLSPRLILEDPLISPLAGLSISVLDSSLITMTMSYSSPRLPAVSIIQDLGTHHVETRSGIWVCYGDHFVPIG